MRLFRPKPPIDRDEVEWLLACFAWLHREIDREERSNGFVPQLVRPDHPALASAGTAQDMFDAVKMLAGLGDWHCELRKGEVRQRIAPAPGMGQLSERYALGTFAVEGNTPIIHYHPELLARPQALASTFAHELAHLVLATMGDPPGGEELHEHATDCCASYLGFGVLLANSARQFSQWQEGTRYGWSSSASGYLSEQSHVTALAIGARLFDHDPLSVRDVIKPYLRGDLGKAVKYLDWLAPDMPAYLDQLDLGEWR